MAVNESLILKEQAELESAPFLFSEEDLPEIDKARPKFHCTGERLFRDRQDVYKAIVKLLAEPGVTVRTICETCHVTDDLVRSVKARENIAIAHEKQTVLRNVSHGARLASERVIEMLPTASAKDALIGVGILVDRMQLLSGEATTRIEQVEKIDIYSDWNEVIEKHLEPEHVREIGLAGENKLLTDGGSENAAPASGAGPESDPRPQTDSDSRSADRIGIATENGSPARQDALTDGRLALGRGDTSSELSGVTALTEANV